MLVKDFLIKCEPGVRVRVFDLDAAPGKNLKEDEAFEMFRAYSFNYNSEITEFYICNDNLTIYTRRTMK